MEAPADARARFAAWVESIGRKEVVAILGCHWTWPGLVVRGERLPQRLLAHAIEQATASWPGGPILAEEWDAIDPERVARERRAAERQTADSSGPHEQQAAEPADAAE